MNVTVFKHYSDVGNPIYTSVDNVLHSIKTGGKNLELINKIRNSEDKSERTELKKELPCVCFSGEFRRPIADSGRESYRNDRSLTRHSLLVPIDVDSIDNVDDLKEVLKHEPYVYALWTSSSGRGLHGLVKISDGNKHREHYRALCKKFPFLDTTAQNESRILFLSYDPDIYINEIATPFYELEQEEAVVVGDVLNISQVSTDYRKLDVAARMIRKAPDGEKHKMLLAASNLMGGYISAGIMEYDVARETLFHEISKKNVDDISLAKKTIEDGLRFGMTRPLTEVNSELLSVEHDLGIIDQELSFLSDNIADEDYIYKFKHGMIPMGVPYGYKDLDEHLLLKEGEFYGILSHANTGKTTINLWLAFLAAYKYNWGWFIFSGENKTASIKMRLIEYYTGYKIKEVPQDLFEMAMKWVNDRFFIMNNLDMVTYKDILNNAIITSKYRSIKGLLIDPYNSLSMELGRATQYDYNVRAYSEILLFTKKHNISTFLSVHTNTNAQRTVDKDGNQLPPRAADAEGGSVLMNKTDNFITIHRNIYDANTWMNTEIYVHKIRNKDTGGNPTQSKNPVILKLRGGVEFVDLYGEMPVKRLPKPTAKNIPF